MSRWNSLVLMVCSKKEGSGGGLHGAGLLPVGEARAAGGQFAQQRGGPAATRGVVIASTDPDSYLASNGLKRGDVILSINQTPTPTVAAAAAVIDGARRSGRDSVLLQVQRGTQPPLYVGVKLQKK